ncbi:hypothetical protein [Paraburkholderia sp. Cpub6]|uniref:hypothetical protein n=1 Tax=Paraburkholderia sp. Cpub6 TaxID=2723094 RepID=UPI00160A7823|nr:hypothetical protein [Paraburkholderia sp. Cpub6]MBB5458726.1 hypothetical protein [Paraburkholderia sp. Cpub6]
MITIFASDDTARASATICRDVFLQQPVTVYLLFLLLGIASVQPGGRRWFAGERAIGYDPPTRCLPDPTCRLFHSKLLSVNH